MSRSFRLRLIPQRLTPPGFLPLSFASWRAAGLNTGRGQDRPGSARFRRMRSHAALGAGLGLLLLTAPLAGAFATPTLSLRLEASGFTPQSFSAAAGSTVLGPTSFAGYTLSVSGFGDIIDNVPYVSLHISISRTPTTLKPLTISLTETEIPTGPGSVLALSTYDNIMLTVSHGTSTVQSNLYYDLTDTAFGQQHLLASSTLTWDSPSSSFDATVQIGSPISVTETLLFTPTSSSEKPMIQSQTDMVVPEPPSSSLLGSGVAGLLLLLLLRHRRAPGRGESHG